MSALPQAEERLKSSAVGRHVEVHHAVVTDQLADALACVDWDWPRVEGLSLTEGTRIEFRGVPSLAPSSASGASLRACFFCLLHSSRCQLHLAIRSVLISLF